MSVKLLYHRDGAADGEAAQQGGASPRRLAATAGGRLGWPTNLDATAPRSVRVDLATPTVAEAAPPKGLEAVRGGY
jgi:hypothetical protein